MEPRFVDQESVRNFAILRGVNARLPHISRVPARFATEQIDEHCACGRSPVMRISWTDRNPGRRFWVFSQREVRDVN